MTNDNEWWRGCVVYQVYPRSFQDTNGDGVGDLPGIIDRMGYIADLGVDAIWISPFFASPMRDFGYDVSDYRDIDPLFGTMRDFERLLAEAHRRDLKVMVDLVVSHTSDQHPWFVESRGGRDNPKADWYTWADPKPDGTPPNNWLSHFGGPAWTWNARRRQYYFHNFLSQQPDLNYHNPEVRAAVLDVFRFWLDKGVDGFRLDTVNMYYQDALLRDNPPCPPEDRLTDHGPYDYQIHIYDKSRPENPVFLEEVRALTDSYPGRALVGEIGGEPASVAPLLTSYTERGKRLHMAYVFDLQYTDFTAEAMRREIVRLADLTAGGWICWSVSNHDAKRVVTRWGLERHADKAVPLIVALLLSLRGSSCVYQGEELGLTEAEIPYECLQDPHGKAMWPEFKGRDGCRTPMPWEKNALNSGFSLGLPWLPIPRDHRERAVDVQAGRSGSVLERCRNFIHWRKGVPELLQGDMEFFAPSGEVIAFRRRTQTGEVAAVFNLGAERAVFRLGEEYGTLAGHGFSGTRTGGEVELEGFDAFFGQRPHR